MLALASRTAVAGRCAARVENGPLNRLRSYAFSDNGEYVQLEWSQGNSRLGAQFWVSENQGDRILAERWFLPGCCPESTDIHG
jgi:hypothetical protein